MRYQDIAIDTEYAVRSKAGAQQVVVHVLVVAKADETKHVTIRHLEPPLAGVEETIGFRHVLASWHDHTVSLYEEGRLAVLRELSVHADHIMMNAVQLVFDSSGESVSVEIDAHVKSRLGPLMRLADRAGFEQLLDAIAPEAFINHRGDVHMSFPEAERLAIAFAQNEPEPSFSR